MQTTFCAFDKLNGEGTVQVRLDRIVCVHEPCVAHLDHVVLQLDNGETLDVEDGYEAVMNMLGIAVKRKD